MRVSLDFTLKEIDRRFFFFQLDIKHDHNFDGCLKLSTLMLGEQLRVNLSHMGVNHEVNVGKHIFLEVGTLHAAGDRGVLAELEPVIIFIY